LCLPILSEEWLLKMSRRNPLGGSDLTSFSLEA
jgi:hypothetical protein